MQTQKLKHTRLALPAGVVALLGSAILAPGMARAVTFDYSGYIREHLSVNLQDTNEYKVTGFLDPGQLTTSGEKFGGKGDLSMWRHSGKLEASADFGPFQIAGVGRIARETRTQWGRDLQNNSKLLPAFTTLEQAGPLLGAPVGATVFANASAFTSEALNALLGTPGCVPVCAFAPGLVGFGGGTQDDLALEQYDSTELREAYVSRLVWASAPTSSWANSRSCGARPTFSAPWTSSTAMTCVGARSWKPRMRNCASR